ncbi:MAG: aminopeptidase P N-terminal domain-containing protein [Chloroflexota bacterium]|nr:aminopeptidase P N-terminal domain-containing protein [Chloroflexota bacterium]
MKKIDQKEYQNRRKKLFSHMEDNSILLISGEEEKIRNNDVNYEFRQGSDFWYLTGLEEPDALMILLKKDTENYILFSQEKKVEEEVWTGYKIGKEKAKSVFLADSAYHNNQLDKLTELLFSCEKIYYNLGSSKKIDDLLSQGLSNFKKTKSRTGTPNPLIIDPSILIDSMRLIKNQNEIEVIQKAIDITAKGFAEAFKFSNPGKYEYEVQEIMEKEFRFSGAKRNGYPSIVASGKNSCILHYIENNQKLKKGSLILIDAGSEWDYYSADVTRTWPVNGIFSSEQKDIYEIVLEANLKAIKECKIGNTINDPHITALKTLVEGLKHFKILNGSIDEIIEKKLYVPFYMHSTSHWLGLDVHDSGKYKDREENFTKFKEGMILTIEPGLYFGDMAQKVSKHYKNIGIRIEDDILITKSGPKNLSENIPKSIKDLENSY